MELRSESGNADPLPLIMMLGVCIVIIASSTGEQPVSNAMPKDVCTARDFRNNRIVSADSLELPASVGKVATCTIGDKSFRLLPKPQKMPQTP